MTSGQSGFTRLLVLVLLIIILLAIFHVDVRGYITTAWNSYVYPFVSSQTFSGLSKKVYDTNHLPKEGPIQ